MSGGLKLQTGDREMVLVAGQLVLWHLQHSCLILEVQGEPIMYTVSFSRTFALKHTQKALRPRFLTLLMAEKLPLVRVGERKLISLLLLMGVFSIREKQGETRPLHKQLLLEGFNRLVLELLDMYAHYIREMYMEGHSRKNHLVLEFLELVERHCKQWHKMYFYANKLAVTPNYLSKQVCSVTGKSTKDFIHKTLLREAKIMLRTESTIRDIGEELGFGTPSAFCRFFKRHTNSSPTQYRERLDKG
jgi:AraC-like DNA-binding protein